MCIKIILLSTLQLLQEKNVHNYKYKASQLDMLLSLYNETTSVSVFRIEDLAQYTCQYIILPWLLLLYLLHPWKMPIFLRKSKLFPVKAGGLQSREIENRNVWVSYKNRLGTSINPLCPSTPALSSAVWKTLTMISMTSRHTEISWAA